MANKVRLIDAEKCYCIAKAYHSDFEQNMANLHSLRELLDDCPTEDAEPVVRGHWGKHNFLGHNQYACSECQTLGSPQWKRCPVCEAKMDGDGNV